MKDIKKDDKVVWINKKYPEECTGKIETICYVSSEVINYCLAPSPEQHFKGGS